MGDAFRFVGSLGDAIAQPRRRPATGSARMGGADLIRQAFAGGHVDEFPIIVAPVILGGGKHLFDGFEQDVELEHKGVRQSDYATSSTTS